MIWRYFIQNWSIAHLQTSESYFERNADSNYISSFGEMDNQHESKGNAGVPGYQQDPSSLYRPTEESSVVPPGDSGCSELPRVSAGSRNEDECQSPDCKTSPVFCKNEFPSFQLHPRDETSSTGADVSRGGRQMVSNKMGIESAEHLSKQPILQGQC